MTHFRLLKPVLACAALLGLLAATPALADTPQRTLTVNGHGTASGTPDSAQISAGVTTQATNAADALARNSAKMNAVFAALRSLGIPDRDIGTSDFAITPQYAPYNANGSQSQHITGYQVSNQVDVILDDPKRMGPAIDALVGAGANQMNSISFAFRDPKALLAQARSDAVDDAMTRADQIAKAAHVTLGAIVSISDNSSPESTPVYAGRMSVAGMLAPTPIASGQQSLAADVSITWEIQ